MSSRIYSKENEKRNRTIAIVDLVRAQSVAAQSVAAKSANWALGQLARAFHYRKASCLVPLYKTFVRPKLEHAVVAWSPWTEADKEVLEKVQRRMVRMISDKRGNTYEERLKNIGLTTLTERRERGDAIETFKTFQQRRYGIFFVTQKI